MQSTLQLARLTNARLQRLGTPQPIFLLEQQKGQEQAKEESLIRRSENGEKER